MNNTFYSPNALCSLHGYDFVVRIILAGGIFTACVCWGIYFEIYTDLSLVCFASWGKFKLKEKSWQTCQWGQTVVDYDIYSMVFPPFACLICQYLHVIQNIP